MEAEKPMKYTTIAITFKTRNILIKRKLKAEEKLNKPLTWDQFLGSADFKR
jgi:hypothetical protein